MTHEEAFERLLGWAKVFGYPVEEANFAEGHWPEGLEEGTRGFFHRDRIGSPGWIWVRPGLPPEERTGVLAHEVSHMALSLLKVEPYQRLTHEPTADLLGKCLVAMIWEDYGNPLFRISRIADLIKAFCDRLTCQAESLGRFNCGVILMRGGGMGVDKS